MALRRTVVSWVAVMLGAASWASAHSVSVDTGAYRGEWYAAGQWRTGPAVLELATGRHGMSAGEQGGFYVDVAADGQVTLGPVDGQTTPQPTCVVGGLRAIRFDTRDVRVESGLYAGQWIVARVHGWGEGPATLPLV